jgi:transposase-like protein
MRIPELLSDPAYHDEDAARAYLEEVRWPDGPFCPFCGAFETVKPLGGPSMGPGWYYCSACQDKFTVRVGSIMERSHIPLHKWLLAFRLMASSKKGVSAHQIHRTLGITYKSAWFLMHRIREAMNDNGAAPLGGEGKIVEANETFTVHKEGGPTWILHPEHGWQKSRSPLDRVPVVTLVERGGRARSQKTENVTAATLRSVVLGSADTKSRLMTDELRAYRRIGQRFAGHDTVRHEEEEWARKLEDGTKAHTNTVEGFFSILKRGIYGCYFHVSEQHLHRYLAEFDFRYSNRVKLGVDDTERTRRAIKGAGGKRLTYRRTRSQNEETRTA